MTLEEIDPELFLWELYNANGLYELDDALCTDATFGYCDASRLRVRPRSGGYALMVEWRNGEKYWCHVDKRILEIIRKRIGRKEGKHEELEEIADKKFGEGGEK